MNIIKIYKKYGIPKQLQEHMLRVTACSSLILDNWDGPSVDRNMLTRILLLHDMGNLVKIVEEYTDKNFISNRDKYLSMYGNDDHAVSEAIGKELGLNEKELFIMGEKCFMNNEDTRNSNSYEIKIGAYCDQRVAPTGVFPLMERMMEGKERYKDRPGTSFNNPKTDYMIACAEEIERQIMQCCHLTEADITDHTIAPYIEQLKQYEI